VAVVAASGCERGRVLEPTIRLTQWLAGVAPGAPVVRCAVADDIRPAIGCVEPVVLAKESLPATSHGPTPYVVAIAEPLRSGRSVVDVRLLGTTLELLGGESVPIAAGTASSEFVLRLPDTPPAVGQLSVRATGFAVPPDEQRHATRPLALERGAVLEFAVGFEPALARAGASPAEFRVSALLPRGEVEVWSAVFDPKEVGDRWVDRRVSLDRLADVAKGVRLVLSTRVVARAGDDATAAFSAPLWGAPAVLEPRARAAQRNVVLVSLDTLRGDFVGASIGGVPLTPEIDRLAAAGTSFIDASSAFPSTTASHMTMMTGLYPAVHGVGVGGGALPPSIPTLAERLASQGWATGASTEDAMLYASAGFPRGFDSYREQKGLSPLDTRGDIEATFASGMQWLAAHRDEKTFLFLHTYQVHEPYTPPAEWALSPSAQRAPGDPCPAADAEDRHGVDCALYAGEVRWTDAVVGRLADELRRSDLLDDTILILTSDHGEEFGEHGGRSHARTLYREVLHVPLVVVAPGLVPAGLRIDVPVSLADVAPTVLALVGLEPPRSLSGASLAGLLRGDPFPADRVLFAEKGPLSDRQRLVEARRGALAWIFRGDRDEPAEVYDVVADPGETQPLDDPALREAGRPLLAVHRRMRDAAAALRGAGATAPIASDVDDPTLRKLRALGYVE